jgi:hypothetical protein
LSLPINSYSGPLTFDVSLIHVYIYGGWSDSGKLIACGPTNLWGDYDTILEFVAQRILEETLIQFKNLGMT